jgi:hypothetical protein
MVILNYTQLVLIPRTLVEQYSRLEYFRQLWWGQQIPAYFYGDGKEDFVVAEYREALVLA